ncbi:MAG: fatty acid desaturase [Pseudomonadota bacterium]
MSTNIREPSPESAAVTGATPAGKPQLLWVQTLLFAITGGIAVIGVPLWAFTIGFDWVAVVGFILFAGLSGISITAGYHRLWAHNAYRARLPLRLLFALFGAATVQNSILTWVAGHRRHHRHVDDNEQDPYSAGRGLWFSHIGWMIRDYPSGYEDYRNVDDLKRDRVVMWQHNNYLAITLFMNFAPPLLVGWLTGDWLANLLLMGVARLVFTHHTTFFINSLAHFWGRRPYTEENSARDNDFLAFFTYGEGYHNYHHKFQRDYRNGVKWWQFDPTKWLIWTASKLGLTSQLYRVDRIRIREAEVQMQLQRAEERLEQVPDETMRDRWQRLLDEERERLTRVLEEFRALSQAAQDEGREQIRTLERALKAQLRRVGQLHLDLGLALA